MQELGISWHFVDDSLVCVSTDVIHDVARNKISFLDEINTMFLAGFTGGAGWDVASRAPSWLHVQHTQQHSHTLHAQMLNLQISPC